MALIIPVRGFTPTIGENCFLAPNSTIIGDVTCGDECSFWFNSVSRGDVNSIILGNRVNVQDNVVIHCTFEKSKTIVGNNVSIGHNAVIHGCEIHDNVLVGMSSVIMGQMSFGVVCQLKRLKLLRQKLLNFLLSELRKIT